MWKVCLLRSQSNKIVWLPNLADTFFFLRNSRGAQRKMGFFFLIVLSWLAGQVNLITWWGIAFGTALVLVQSSLWQVQFSLYNESYKMNYDKTFVLTAQWLSSSTQVHRAQHCGSRAAVGSTGPVGHANETQPGAADPGQEHHRRVRGDSQGVHHHVQVSTPVKLSVLMLCAPSNPRRPFSYHTKMADFKYFRVLSVFSWHFCGGINSEKCTGYGKQGQSGW